MFKKVSIFWIIMTALLITSAFPLSVMAVRAIETVESGVESEQRRQLLARVDAHAAAIDQQFQKFQVATELAAAQARSVLVVQEPLLTQEQIDARLAKYQREGPEEIADRRAKQTPGGDSIIYDEENPYKLGVLGLDNWYNNVYLRQNPGDIHQSNVFLNNQTELTPRIAYHIAVTEDLNPVFRRIVESSIGTQWVYMTTAEGMMRLYPWAGNYKYPVNWEPQTISFYTVAAPERNPERKAVWTAPYNDFARAGLMVTNSVPIYEGDRLVAVMSHDFVIRDLQRQVLDFEVGTKGFAFLIDSSGNIVAHKDYNPEDTPLGEELSIKLADKDSSMSPVVDSMLDRRRGITSRIDADGEEWLVVYAQIPTTDWHLGMMQPRSEIIQPATDIRNQLIPIAGGLVLIVVLVSVVVARGIARPVRQLTDTAEEIEATVDEETQTEVYTQRLSHISGTSEIMRLVDVFSDMVSALKRRMNELSSIYTMGQTITSNVDFDKTLQAVLSAVRQVVEYDAAEIAILQEGTTELVVQAWWGKSGFRDTTGRTQKLGYGLMGTVAATKEPVFVPAINSVEDVQRMLNQPEFDGRLIIESGLKSLLGIPLSLHNKLLGVLMLVHKVPGHFTEDDRRQLIKLAAQASVAISNAMQVRQRESALKKQILELQIEIDESKKSKQVQEIVESDFFRELQQKAESMRARSKVSAVARGSEAPQAPEEA